MPETGLKSPQCQQHVVAEMISRRWWERGGVVIVGAPGSGRTSLGRALARSYAGLRVRWVCGQLATRQILGAAISVLCPGTTHRDAVDDASRVSGRLAHLADTGLLLVDDAENVDQYSAAILATVVKELRIPLLLITSAHGSLPEAFARVVTTQAFEVVRLEPLDEDEALALLEFEAGGPVEAASARRLLNLAEGVPLLLRLLTANATETGHLREHSGIRVLASGWQPDPKRCAPILGARVPSNHDPAVWDVLCLVSALGEVHVDDLSAMGLDDGVLTLIDMGCLHSSCGHETGWTRPGVVVRHDALTAAAIASTMDEFRFSKTLCAFAQVADPEGFPGAIKMAYYRAALRAGLRPSAAELLVAYREAAVTVCSDDQLAFCRHIAESRYCGDRTGGFPEQSEDHQLRHALASYLNWHGDVGLAAKLLAPGVEAGHLPTRLLAAVLALANSDSGASAMLRAVADTAERDSVERHRAEGWGCIAAIRSGDNIEPDEILHRCDDPRIDSWLRCELVAAAAFVLVARGHGRRALDVIVPHIDQVRRDDYSHRAQTALWHSAMVAVSALGLPLEWVTKHFAAPEFSWLRIPASAAHLVAANILGEGGWVKDALGAFRDSLALLDEHDAHRLQGLAVVGLRRALLPLCLAENPEWDRIRHHACGGAISGPRHQEVRAYQEAYRLLESGQTEIDEPLQAVLRGLQHSGFVYIEFTVLYRLWRFGVVIDTARLIALADRCDGVVAAAVAAELRGQDDDSEALRAVDLFLSAKRRLLAAEAAMLRIASLEDRCGPGSPEVEEAVEMAGRVVTGLGSVFTPLLGLRSTEDPALSARERQIASLVAAGHSNREVAEKLALSPRTIDAHMARIMGKLEIHSRRLLRNPGPDSSGYRSTGEFPQLIRKKSVRTPSIG